MYIYIYICMYKKRGLPGHDAIRLNAMFKAVKLPTRIPNLNSSLSYVNAYYLPHLSLKFLFFLSLKSLFSLPLLSLLGWKQNGEEIEREKLLFSQQQGTTTLLEWKQRATFSRLAFNYNPPCDFGVRIVVAPPLGAISFHLPNCPPPHFSVMLSLYIYSHGSTLFFFQVHHL